MGLLCCQWLNVSGIVEQLDVTQPTVSHHLSVLRSAGLVKVRRDGKQAFYTLNQDRLTAGCCQLVELYAPEREIVVAPTTK